MMQGWRWASVAAAALMGLAIAGCTGMYPGDTEQSNTRAFHERPQSELWDMGYSDGLKGLDNTGLGNAAYNSGYQSGFSAKNNPTGPKPSNPYNRPPSPTPAGNQPPSATGGG